MAFANLPVVTVRLEAERVSSWLENIVDRGGLGAARAVAQFAEARQAVLADNIANIDTPYYKVRDLPVAEFRQMLGRAIEESAGSGGPLKFESTRHIGVGADGHLEFAAVERDRANLLFHDQGNRSLEQEMSEAVKNALLHRVAVEMLRKQYETLEVAVRGRL
jgi:flagellar basal-body rod protein FlgB